jgi:large subunit ribosomal protein L3
MSGLIGKKIGMARLFDESGQQIVVTIVEAGPCFVTEIRSKENNGYDAVQLSFDEKREKVVTSPLKGHFKRANVKPMTILREFDFSNSATSLKLGDELRVNLFAPGDIVDVKGISKGKGFAGNVKRHHFSGGPRTHGQSDRHRAPGSIGQSSYPSRVHKGTRMAGRMGGQNVTMKNLKIVKVDNEKNYLMIKGAIPGFNKNYVVIKKA